MALHNVATSRGFRAGALGLAVALSLGLAGCNSGESPGQGGTTAPASTSLATTSASPTPTPSPTAVYKPADASGPAQNVPVPVMPEVAKTETKEGVEAFTKYWFAILSYAYETGDTELLASYSGAECVFCQGLIDNIRAAWSDSKWISGGQIQTPAVTAEISAAKPTYVTVQVLQKELLIHNPDGSRYQEPTAAINAGSRATATFSEGGWTVSALSLIR